MLAAGAATVIFAPPAPPPMVMPLVDEDDPKCYVCHRRFRTLDELREHQSGERAAAAESGAAKGGAPPPPTERGPAPGDVSMF